MYKVLKMSFLRKNIQSVIAMTNIARKEVFKIVRSVRTCPVSLENFAHKSKCCSMMLRESVNNIDSTVRLESGTFAASQSL